MNKHIVDPKIVEAASKATAATLERFRGELVIDFEKAIRATEVKPDSMFVDELVADFTKAARVSIETSCALLRPDLSPRGPERTPGL